MIDIKLSSADWDLDISGGDLSFVVNADQVVQHIRQRIQTFLGEWFLDLSVGVPWFQDILGKPQRLDIVETTLKTTITGTPGVTSLTSFAIDVDNAAERIIAVSFAVVVNGEEISQTVETTI